MSKQLSPKHGLNPTMLLCPICGKETGEIALMGKLEGDAEAPRYSMGPNICDECREHLEKKHRILIEVEDEGPVPDGIPKRTGRIAYILNPEVLPEIKEGACYCPKDVFELLNPEQNEK